MVDDFRNEWLFKLGQRLGIPELAFDDAGLCQMSLDGELRVAIYKPVDTEDLVVFGELPVDYISFELMQRMLVENRSHIKQNVPVVSLSEKMKTIEVNFKLTQSELEAAEDVMGLLIGHLEYWRTSLANAAY